MARRAHQANLQSRSGSEVSGNNGHDWCIMLLRANQVSQESKPPILVIGECTCVAMWTLRYRGPGPVTLNRLICTLSSPRDAIANIVSETREPLESTYLLEYKVDPVSYVTCNHEKQL